MKRWRELVLIAGACVVALTAQPAPASAQRAAAGSGLARSFSLGDLGGLGDLLGLGGGGLGSLGDLLGLGGDSDALGGVLGDVLGGFGGRNDYGYSDRYSDRYEEDEYPRYRRSRSRRMDRGQARDRLFGRLDLGGNGFVERNELSRFARRPARGASRSQATFNRLDRNRDGRLSQSEFGRLFR
jgi:hypothetical protein